MWSLHIQLLCRWRRPPLRVILWGSGLYLLVCSMECGNSVVDYSLSPETSCTKGFPWIRVVFQSIGFYNFDLNRQLLHKCFFKRLKSSQHCSPLFFIAFPSRLFLECLKATKRPGRTRPCIKLFRHLIDCHRPGCTPLTIKEHDLSIKFLDPISKAPGESKTRRANTTTLEKGRPF